VIWGACCHHVLSQRVSQASNQQGAGRKRSFVCFAYSSDVKTEAICSLETLVNFCWTVLHYIPITAVKTWNPAFKWCFEYLLSTEGFCLFIILLVLHAWWDRNALVVQLWFVKPSWLLHPLFCELSAANWSKARQGKIGLLHAWFCYALWKSVTSRSFPLAKCMRLVHSLVLLLMQSVHSGSCWLCFQLFSILVTFYVGTSTVKPSLN
jgi:hypothetical protein